MKVVCATWVHFGKMVLTGYCIFMVVLAHFEGNFSRFGVCEHFMNSGTFLENLFTFLHIFDPFKIIFHTFEHFSAVFSEFRRKLSKHERL